jgi:hypothetical protein
MCGSFASFCRLQAFNFEAHRQTNVVGRVDGESSQKKMTSGRGGEATVKLTGAHLNK